MCSTQRPVCTKTELGECMGHFGAPAYEELKEVNGSGPHTP